MKHVIAAFDNCPLVTVKDRKYMITPLTDHYPETPYELIEDTVNELAKLTDFSKADKLVGEEERGGFITALMALKEKKAFALAKWNPIGLEGEITLSFRNAYAGGSLYLNGVKKGEKVILVEDLIDSGGTIVSLIKLLQSADIQILDVVAIAEKADFNGVERIKKETGFEVKHLLKFTVSGEKSKVTWVHNQAQDK